jgi:hypothetical protein
MPLFLVRVSRVEKVIEFGDFSIEADSAEAAKTKAGVALSKGDPGIDWNGESGKQHGRIKIEEIEILATGTEDIGNSLG